MRVIYSVIRFVPDPARAEFINVGAIAGSEEAREWDVRQIQNLARARSIDQRGSLDAVGSFIGEIGRRIDAFKESERGLFPTAKPLTEAWLHSLHADHQNVVQLSPPTPMLAVGVEDALDTIFAEMILDPASPEYRFKKKHGAQAALRDAYRALTIRANRDFHEGVQLQTGPSRLKLDFAVTNGKVVQLVHTWSFQLQNQSELAEEIRAWGWVIEDLRRSGGAVTVGESRIFHADKDTDVEVLYVPPARGQESPALLEARHVSNVLGVPLYPETQANKVAKRAEQLLHGGGGRLDLSTKRRRSGSQRGQLPE